MLNASASTVAYTPIYFTPLVSQNCPAPPTSQTGLYTLTVAPTCSLDIGTPVHLHYICITGEDQYLHAPNDPAIIPLAIWGKVAGERSRTDSEVELVVKNEVPNSPIQRAFVRFRFSPGSLPIPSLSNLVALRFPHRSNGSLFGPQVRPDSLPVPDVPLDEITEDCPRAETPEYLAPFLPRSDLMMTMDLRFVKDPSQARATAVLPYNIWESYGGTATSGPRPCTRAERDAIENYGCPIVVRVRSHTQAELSCPLRSTYR